MLRTASSLPLNRAFDAGLRPGPFPGEAASLLPGLLTATRTGLPPASDDELTSQSSTTHSINHQSLLDAQERNNDRSQDRNTRGVAGAAAGAVAGPAAADHA